MILHFEIEQTNNKPYISNQRALLRCDAGVGRDKSHVITTSNHWFVYHLKKSLKKSFAMTTNMECSVIAPRAE